MIKTIDMQDLRHLNLFSKITRMTTRFSFEYNNMIVFCVPKFKLAKAVGDDARNVKRIGQILKKRVRIIAQPRGEKDLPSFVRSIIRPVEFQDIKIDGDEVVITAGPQSKAALLGRYKRRFAEMQKIIKEYFNKELRII